MKNSKYKIAFLTTFNPKGKTSWAGTSRYMALSLEKHAGEVIFLGPLELKYTFLVYFSRIIKKLTGKTYNIAHSIILARKYAKLLKRKLKGKDYDIIFAPASSTALAYLKTSIPVIYYTDTTFKTLYNYYEWFSGFCALSRWEGNIIEKRALTNSDYLLLTSEWVKESVINDYGIYESKITLDPMGANIKKIPEAEIVLNREKGDCCRLVFIGMEWIRKGGQIAVDTVNSLNKMGIKAHLTMIGCNVPEKLRNNNLTVIEYINKDNPEEKKQFREILFKSHFLLLPTRAECYGIVFCEASAYAIPSITTDTGGISAAVKNGENGFRLPLQAGAEEYANKIASIYTDYSEKYKPLSKSSRMRFEKTCNWDHWGLVAKKLMDSHFNR